MKNTLSIGLFVLISNISISQVEIYSDTLGSPSVSGTTIDVAMDNTMTFPVYTNIYVKNVSGADELFRITRERTNVPTNWVDEVCWPPTCYSGISGDFLYNTPNTLGNPAPVLINNTWSTTSGFKNELKPQIVNNPGANSVGVFTYYVTNEDGAYVDSVIVRFTYTLSTLNLPSLEVSVQPNPANDLVQIKNNSGIAAELKLFDVLGNEVYSENNFITAQTIDVSALDNGIYFIVAEANGTSPFKQKLIVQH